MGQFEALPANNPWLEYPPEPEHDRMQATPDVCHVVAGHRLFLTFAASSVCAPPAPLMLWVYGAVTEGFAGQTTMTKLGLVICSIM